MSLKSTNAGLAIVDDTMLAAMTNCIVSRFAPLRIVLFGSRARRDHSPFSDVDLLVVLPECADVRRAAIEIRRALAGFRIPKDIVVTTPDEIARRGDLIGTVLRPALQEGQVLYERS